MTYRKPNYHPNYRAVWGGAETISDLIRAADQLEKSLDECGCAICGRGCVWRVADPEAEAPSKFGGWYCGPCDAFTETDVELED